MSESSAYKPFLLDSISLDQIKAPAYRDFVLDAAITPGCRLLLDRSRRRPDWPYVDTKFNPNTGKDLPDESYDVVHAWFLGRGSEGLDGHLRWLEQMPSLPTSERDQIKSLFERLIQTMTDAIVRVTDLNNGRLPFRVNRDLQAVDADGQPTQADGTRTGAGDIFAAKGVLAANTEETVERSLKMMLRIADLIRKDRFDVDQFADQPTDAGQRQYMLMQGAAVRLCRKAKDAEVEGKILDVAAEFLAHALEYHYDEESGRFSEYIDPSTKERREYLDPGHATELVGFGLGALECMEKCQESLAEERRSLIARVRQAFPRLLIKAFEVGFNKKHPGMYRAVNNRTGKPINDNMPWWNLPETMRAAIRACEVATDDETRAGCLEVLRCCHNAYFGSYLNPDNSLFPYQSINGTTGKVVDKAPAVPEGDPLYHTNLSLLEMLEVIERM